MAVRTALSTLLPSCEKATLGLLRSAASYPSGPVLHSATRIHRSLVPSSRLWTRLPAEQRQAFTASAARRKTVSLTKPKLDMGGHEMSIEITPRAGQQLSSIIKETNNPSFALRIRVQSGGCHGFQYITANETLPPDPSSVAEEDCVFRYVEEDHAGGARTGSTAQGFEGPKVIMDDASLLSLQGSKVDFIQELIGSKFEVVDNPGAENSCGCGSSFSLKL